jgi:heterodisulfide reductase subunit C
VPEAVMKATAHWLELKGHTAPSNSTIFDDVFTHQVIKHGKIEDGEVLKDFMKKTKQPLAQDWVVQMIKQMIKGLPIGMLMKMGMATIFHPKTKGWASARTAINEHIAEEHAKQRKSLSLDAAE